MRRRALTRRHRIGLTAPLDSDLVRRRDDEAAKSERRRRGIGPAGAIVVRARNARRIGREPFRPQPGSAPPPVVEPSGQDRSRPSSGWLLMRVLAYRIQATAFGDLDTGRRRLMALLSFRAVLPRGGRGRSDARRSLFREAGQAAVPRHRTAAARLLLPRADPLSRRPRLCARAPGHADRQGEALPSGPLRQDRRQGWPFADRAGGPQSEARRPAATIAE